jgi:hypothetical protein
MFPQHNSHKFTRTSPNGKIHNQIIHSYQNVDRTGEGIQVYLTSDLSRGADCDLFGGCKTQTQRERQTEERGREREATSKQAM